MLWAHLASAQLASYERRPHRLSSVQVSEGQIMTFYHGIAVGVIIGVVITLFTSLLTELIVIILLGAVVFYFGRKRWLKKDTPSTTNPLQ